MSEALSFNQVYEQFAQCFQQGEYQAAYDLVSQVREQFPADAETIDYLRICAVARLGDTARVCRMIEEKHRQGLWYGEAIFRRTPSFQPLQGHPEFERLAAMHQQLAEADRERGGLLVAEPAGGCAPEGGVCPLIIALHGNGQTNRHAHEAWQPAAAMGWLVGAPLSSQAMRKDAAMWDDYATASQDVLNASSKLTTEYAVDPKRVILGGFSMGGETAIRMALEGKLGVRGFIALGPGGPGMDAPEETFAGLRDGARERGLRGAILSGDADDTIPQEAIRRLVGMLNEAGIPCHFETAPGIGHVYPENFGEMIARSVAFILDE